MKLFIPAAQLNVEQFYELHVEAPQGDGSPVKEFSGFAVFLEAASKRFDPEQIPFTIRNWDSRITDYMYLSDRLGLRMMGLWGEPNEEYFKAGYQNSLDSYDFHVYEHYSNVRLGMKQYRALMEKYDAVKPILSTKLGLNSSGQARIAVAFELIKKCTVFFAEGGESISWLPSFNRVFSPRFLDFGFHQRKISAPTAR